MMVDRWFLGLLLGMSGAIAVAIPAKAQSNIVEDPTVGTTVIDNFLGFPIEAIRGGAERGQNLFHSFQEFNVSPDRAAIFLIPNGTIQNVFARVTGQDLSRIDGRLATRLDGTFAASTANLFLMNPNGIIFGPGSRLDVGGSFVATTADAIGFGDRGSFSTTNPAAPSELLTINPSAFLFNQIPSGNIVNRSVANGVGLRVPNGQSLTLLGGDVSLEGGRLNAWGGRVELGAVAGPGQVAMLPSGALGFAAELARGTVALTEGARVDVSLNGGGAIGITAGDIRLTGESFLLAGIGTPGGTASSRAGDVRLDATGLLSVEGGGVFNIVQPGATVNAGSILVNADSLSVTNGAQLGSFTFGQGDAGNILINVRDAATFDGVGSTGGPSGAWSQVAPTAVGDGGTLTLNAGSLSVTNGAILTSSTFGQGNAGNILINVRDAATFDGVGSTGGPSFAGSTVNSTAVGDGGTLTFNAGSLSVTNGAQLTSSTFGQGNAGNILINVRDAATFDGVGSTGASSGAGSVVQPSAVGNGGTLTLNAGSLSVTNGAQLSSSTGGRGDAGNISINVRDAATFDGVGSNADSSGAGSVVQPSAVGNGGTLTLNAGSLNVTSGAQLSSSAFGRGDAGNISINVRDAATFDGVGSNERSSGAVNVNAVGTGGTLPQLAGYLNVINGAQLNPSSLVFFDRDSLAVIIITNGVQLSSSNFVRGDADNISINVRDAATIDGVGSNGSPNYTGSQTNSNTVGKDGTLTLYVGSLNVTNGAQLTSNTFGQGDAGNVSINVRDAATFDGVGSNGTSSRAGSTVELNAVGNGGALTLMTGSLNVTNGAILISSTFGQGNAGNVSITADSATFNGVGRNRISSGAGSTVEFNAAGNGGTLTLIAGSLNVTNGAQLNSSTLGRGDAGDIVIRVRDMLQMSNGTIATFSRQTAGGSIDITAKSIRLFGNSNIVTSVFSGIGNGGNITLSANSIVALNDSDILAFARDGRGGNITLNTPAFFGQNYRPAPLGTDPVTLEGNGWVDINASGTISGTITTPDVSFIQNSLNPLTQTAIDTNQLLATTCIIRRNQPNNNTFYITGTGTLPERPGTPTSPTFSTGEVRPLEPPSTHPTSDFRLPTSNSPTPKKPWKIGDPIQEPTGFHPLPNGELILSHQCP